MSQDWQDCGAELAAPLQRSASSLWRKRRAAPQMHNLRPHSNSSSGASIRAHAQLPMPCKATSFYAWLAHAMRGCAERKHTLRDVGICQHRRLQQGLIHTRARLRAHLCVHTSYLRAFTSSTKEFAPRKTPAHWYTHAPQAAPRCLRKQLKGACGTCKGLALSGAARTPPTRQACHSPRTRGRRAP